MVDIAAASLTGANTLSPGEFNIVAVNEDGTLLVEATANAKQRHYVGEIQWLKYGTKTYRINGIQAGGFLLEPVSVVTE